MNQLSNLIFNILVVETGAHESLRPEFVRWFCSDRILEPNVLGVEFRFQGSLGFGGKFWRSSRLGPEGGWERFYINCYREYETPRAKKIIKKVNKLLEGI